MTHDINAVQLDKSKLAEETNYSLLFEDAAGSEINLRFRFGQIDLAQANDFVVLRNMEKLDILRNLDRYPSVLRLADVEKSKSDFSALDSSLRDVLISGRSVYIFGAHKVGAIMARLCIQHGLKVVGFIDNNPTKQGQLLDGIPIFNPDQVKIWDEIVVIGSGRYSNEILRQIADRQWPIVLNAHQFFFGLRAPHCAESDFRSFSAALYTHPNRFISAFLELDDDRSRLVFDGLIRMRATLDTGIADEFKSPFEDEYLDSSYISARDIAYYVDAGAFTGDTLDRLERRLGLVEHAYMFEPELPAYYEGLKKYSSRNNVFFYNFGLSSSYSKFVYQPESSFDPLNEINNRVPNDITSFVQAVRLDDVITGNVTLFKLDIEGAEESALQGATKTIRRYNPKLCVCAYHRADDLWKLLDQVKKIYNGYKVGLRHYSDIIDDTSFYFY